LVPGVDQKLAGLLQLQAHSRAERNRLHARDLLLRLQDGHRRNALQGIDEAHYRLLEVELTEPAVVDQQRLGQIEREYVSLIPDHNSDTLSAEYFEGMWREQESDHEVTQENVRDEAQDVDAQLSALVESLRSPSPEREVAVASNLLALQNELRQVRSDVQEKDILFDKEQQLLSEALSRPGASGDPQRLADVHRERTQLRMEWGRQIQRRLETTQQGLRMVQSQNSLRDPEIEAELARQIAMIEREAQYPPF
jgi:hypothetical protein